MKRDLRDPQKLGELYMALREKGVPIKVAVSLPAEDYRSDESCVEKYGRADEVEPRWMEVRVR